MENITVDINSKNVAPATEGLTSERFLWTAVLKLAVDDWREGTLRERRAAQKFIFEETEYLNQVCANAGLDADTFRRQCLKIGQKIAMHGAWHQPLAA